MHKRVNFTAHEAAWYAVWTARHTFDIYSRAENQGEQGGVQSEGEGESAAS